MKVKLNFFLNLFLFYNLILYHFLFLDDPLADYKIKEFESLIQSQNQFFYSNSILKFLSDLFSVEKARNTTNIFYLNDFNVLLDIVIRKLSDLTAEDQVYIMLKFKNNIF